MYVGVSSDIPQLPPPGHIALSVTVTLAGIEHW
jgi:hypothetical protein